MEAFTEQARNAEGCNTAASGRVADFDKAAGGVLRNAEGQARGAAHDDVGGLAVDKDGRRAEAERAEMRADELDFPEGKRGGGTDVVDARIGEDFSGGM
jgi:hypothetical protein